MLLEQGLYLLETWMGKTSLSINLYMINTFNTKLLMTIIEPQTKSNIEAML